MTRTHPPLISAAEAEARLRTARPDWGRETVSFFEAAGRVLAQEVRSDRPQPPFPRAAMDGLAVGSLGPAGTVWPVERLLLAGQEPGRLNNPAAGIEIMTGASVPAGCATVIPYEDLDLVAAPAAGAPTSEGPPRAFRFAPRRPLAVGAHIHGAGDDAPAGRLILAPGAVLAAPDIALLASVGLTQVAVRRLPRAAILSTGDELVPVETSAPEAWQVRQSNRWALAAEWSGWGGPLAGTDHLPDDPKALARGLSAWLEQADLVILSGGVSLGEADFLPRVFADLGLETLFHGVDQKPGKPLLAGRRGRSQGPDQLILGLPGNPVSALVNLRRYAIPLLDRGAPVWQLWAGPLPRSDRGTLFAPCRRAAPGPILGGETPLAAWLRPLAREGAQPGAEAPPAEAYAQAPHQAPATSPGPSVEAAQVPGSGDLVRLCSADGFAELGARGSTPLAPELARGARETTLAGDTPLARDMPRARGTACSGASKAPFEASLPGAAMTPSPAARQESPGLTGPVHDACCAPSAAASPDTPILVPVYFWAHRRFP